MSDPEGFLTRWSRRKREAEESAPVTKPTEGVANESAASADANDAAPRPAEPPAAEPAMAEPPVVDLAALPPIESITAMSDIRAFLAPGVPLQLTRAALRRVWVTDPAIREFVGLAENAWDFTAPDSVPGFASALSAAEAQRLIAHAVGLENPPAAEPPGRGEALQNPDVSAEREGAPASADVEETEVLKEAGPAPAEQNKDYAAVQKEEAAEDHSPRIARHHGGALPR